MVGFVRKKEKCLVYKRREKFVGLRGLKIV